MIPHTQWAKALHESARAQKPRDQFSAQHTYTLDDAYRIQHALIQERVNEGHSIVGVKMGFTSVAKMKQMGVDDMIIGQLTADMWITEHQPLVRSQCIHPRAEPEIAFRLSKDITSPLSVDEVSSVVDGVASAIEVIDSRYENFKFSLEDVVADNCSSCGFALGPWCEVPLGLNGLDMIQTFDHHIVAQGTSDAILDNPFEALAAATRLALQYGLPLKKGMIVLAGASTAAHFIGATKNVEVTVDGLGSAQFNMA
ncbi:MAG: fumarylacetoacetate hydrolase family protein [Schleiferiaceae bacterium]|nr:fumarylacetoacetate hydrolase family protein [Schleiferiaceae bacterium]